MAPYKKFDFSSICKLESDPQILKFKTHQNILLWPLIRYYFFQEQINAAIGVQNPWARERTATWSQWINMLLVSLKCSPLNIRLLFKMKTKHCIIFSSTTAVVTYNGRNFNRLTEPIYGLLRDKIGVVENSYNSRWPSNRDVDSLLNFDWFLAPAIVLGRFRPINHKDANAIEAMLLFLQEKTIVTMPQSFWDELRIILIHSAKKLPLILKFFTFLLKFWNPKLIFVDNGCYGGTKALLLYVANRLGIQTAEYQHGLINANHPAYNYSRRMGISEYLEYMPKDFLAYGKYWADGINIPVTKILAGNPYLSIEMDRVKNLQTRSDEILIVSAGINPEMIDDFIENLLRLDNSLKDLIRLRLHPCEKSVIGLYPKSRNLQVRMDQDSLYSSLAKCKAVVGEISTVLYESLNFDIPVFVFKGEFTDVYGNVELFSQIDDANSFLKLLNSSFTGNYQHKLSEVWAKNWQHNFLNYIQKYCGAQVRLTQRG